MMPPGMNGASETSESVKASPAVSSCLTVLSRRADFLLAARARRQSAPAFTLQARRRTEAPEDGIRIGFTCSKKVGNAVARNRAKRRLREIARTELPVHGRPGWDYVLIGRPVTTASRDFAALRADLRRALERLHADRS
ncbi:ribonuclease P protein component [Rhodovulum sulfidophilum]|nr:ribonuclease P protein component [Rhodovulum sulfidophilum]MBL3560024.1 ribonuclease P protein component [Rhodovulum sulfidophilum]MCE8418379.1 ribonuclease P protein component [Rhodovulum sulfidophilum]NDK36007.1 ribonuclease P protein component [Rhodovulum sulfidophilum]